MKKTLIFPICCLLLIPLVYGRLTAVPEARDYKKNDILTNYAPLIELCGTLRQASGTDAFIIDSTSPPGPDWVRMRELANQDIERLSPGADIRGDVRHARQLLRMLDIKQIAFSAHGDGSVSVFFSLKAGAFAEYWDILCSSNGYTEENLVDSVKESLEEHRKSNSPMRSAHYCERLAVKNWFFCYNH